MLLGTFAATLVALVALLWIVQRKLIYLPIGEAGSAPTVIATAEDVTFVTEDGLTLGGWFVPVAAPRTTIVVFNGNAGNRSFRAALALRLAERGHAVLLFDYRGYGGNRGSPSETGLCADARAARAYLDSRDDVDPSRVVYFGESLGAAVAVALAVDRPPAALVLRSPFSSMVDAARVHYPVLPVRTLLRDRWPSVERIAHVESPLLVIAGDRDRIVPLRLSRKLFDAAPRGGKQWLEIPGVGHNDIELLDGDRMIAAVDDFVSAAVAD